MTFVARALTLLPRHSSNGSSFDFRSSFPGPTQIRLFTRHQLPLAHIQTATSQVSCGFTRNVVTVRRRSLPPLTLSSEEEHSLWTVAFQRLNTYTQQHFYIFFLGNISLSHFNSNTAFSDKPLSDQSCYDHSKWPLLSKAKQTYLLLCISLSPSLSCLHVLPPSNIHFRLRVFSAEPVF
jgi:hypothetical protein